MQIIAVIQETDGGRPDLEWRQREWTEGSEGLKEEVEWAGLSSFPAPGWGSVGEEWGTQEDSQAPVFGTWVNSGVAD